MSFASMLTGSNPTLSGAKNQMGQIGGTSTTQGMGLQTGAGNMFSALMSGNPAQMARVLGGQIAGQQQSAQQAKNTAAQFGNRSGGTNAAAQSADDATRANINKMISDMTSQAATNAASLGTNLVTQGMNAINQQVDFSQMQMQNWQNSLLGGVAGQAAGAIGGLAQKGIGAAATALFA